ncbi:DUF3861 domain-containing protein [soil metagenome]
MPSHYQITVQPTDATGATEAGPPLSFAVSNHDDLLAILAKMQANETVPHEEAAEFAIGLKLFLEVMIRHRGEPLFKDLWPHMAQFMKRLKAAGPRGEAH